MSFLAQLVFSHLICVSCLNTVFLHRLKQQNEPCDLQPLYCFQFKGSPSFCRVDHIAPTTGDDDWLSSQVLPETTDSKTTGEPLIPCTSAEGNSLTIIRILIDILLATVFYTLAVAPGPETSVTLQTVSGAIYWQSQKYVEHCLTLPANAKTEVRI